MKDKFWESTPRNGYTSGEGRIIAKFFDKNGELRGVHDGKELKTFEPFRLTMKKYEIWIGYYHLGQGCEPPDEPLKVAEIEASSFKIACVMYEHQISLDGLKERMARNDSYIEDAHFGQWYYNPKTNSNGWTGRYFESREEALTSFK